jgi:hypothetical protein
LLTLTVNYTPQKSGNFQKSVKLLLNHIDSTIKNP